MSPNYGERENTCVSTKYEYKTKLFHFQSVDKAYDFLRISSFVCFIRIFVCGEEK